MKTLLLLAGKSTRFWPLYEKSLFPICGKALLEHMVERLQKGGIDDIILVGGAHNLEGAKELYPDLPMVEQEDMNLGMRGALLSALPQCGSESVMIVGGNDVIDPRGYKDLIEKVSQTGAQGALLVQQVEEYFPGGYVELKENRIKSIIEKPGEGNEPEGKFVNIVAHIHNDASILLEALQNVDEERDDGYEQALGKLFKDHKYVAVALPGDWRPVKYPWHLLPLLETFLGEIKGRNVQNEELIDKTAVIKGDVILEEGVRVMPHATIVGPCYIGKNSIVANNALVRGSSVGEDCVVGYCTEVKGSVLHSHVWTHMSYVGDSVIGRNVSFGGGGIVGNFRLDEGEIASVVKGEEINTGLTKFGTVIGNNCRLGIHFSCDPGTKIGEGSFVSSATLVSVDVPEKSFVKMKDGKMDIRENRMEIPDPEEREKYRKKV